MPKYDVISFLSDMGTVDESVGVCKAIIFQQAPHVNIFDITHDVPQFDVRAGALALTRAIQFLPKGIVIAAVDPGSPRDQRFIAVEMEEGLLIGPDNGILAPAAQLIGEPKRVIQLSNPDFRIEAPGNVFAARDILAPAAGVIASGTDLAELGEQIPLDQLVPGMLQLSRHDEGGAFLGEVWSLDRFGNIQLNITPEELNSSNVKTGDSVTIRIGENDFMAKFVDRYADLAIGQVGILIDSTGMISIVKNLDYAARELGIREGNAVAILPQGSSITGRDKTVEVFTETSTPNSEGAGGSALVQGVDQQATVPQQAPQVSQGIISPPDAFGTMPPVQAPQNPVVDPFAQAPIQTPPVSQPSEPVFVEREFVGEPGLPPDPFATPAIEQNPPVQNTQSTFGAPEQPQVFQEYISAPAPIVQEQTQTDYNPAPEAILPTTQQPSSNPGAFGSLQPQIDQTPVASQQLPVDPFASDSIASAPVDPFASNPMSPPSVDPFASNPVAPTPVVQAPVVQPNPPVEPQMETPPASPAAYFPPPAVDNTQVVQPEQSSNFESYNQEQAVNPPQTQPAALPQNVFDLFKGEDENETADSQSDQNPQP